MKNIIKIVTFLSLICISCKPNNNQNEIDCYQLYDVPKKGDIKIEIPSVDLIKLELDSSVISSFTGKLRYRNDTIFYADYLFTYVYAFDKDGKFLKRYLGNGQGPYEMQASQLLTYMPLDKYNHFFIGVSYDTYIYSSNFEKIQFKRFDFKLDGSCKEKVLSKNPPHEARGLYDMNDTHFYKPRIYNDTIYLPLYSEHPIFCYLSDDYFKYSRAMAKVKLYTGEMTDQIGRRSPEFLKYNHLVLDFYCYDISKKGELLVNFPPDSLIYVCDLDFNVKRAYGISGKNMNMDYEEIKDKRHETRIWRSEIKNKGYYHYLEYFDEQDLLFRSYAKGSESETDGLQIYRNETLIADVDVPKKFNVEGYIAPYFYSNAIFDEDEEKIYVYKFKL